MTAFNKNEFRSPPTYFYPGYFWTISRKMIKKDLIAQLREMCAHGAKSVCLHPCPQGWAAGSTMTPHYLTPQYFKIIKALVAECRRLGMNYWLYDEGGFPSGSACGQVFASNPKEFASQSVAATPWGSLVVQQPLVTDPKKVRQCYPNLLTPGVTEKFIELTHEAHRKVVGKHFRDTIRFSFMDEPKAPLTMEGRLTWTADLGIEFKKRKGYALEPFLRPLLKKPADAEPPELTRARVDFYDVWSQLFVERFLAPISRWCRRNGLLSSGHFGGEDMLWGNADFGYGHIMRALRGLDLPGVDVIWRQLFPALRARPRPALLAGTGMGEPIYLGPRSHPFTKYASSVARQSGCPYVLSETFAVYGSGLTPAVMKWVIDYQALRGANLFVFSNISQAPLNGNRLAGCRPHFGPVDPLWKYSDLHHTYAARLSAILAQGKPVCATAFYFDIRSIWAGASAKKRAIARHEAASEALLRRQCDFDFIDDDALTSGKVARGTLTIGKMTYDTLVVPPTDWMEPNAAKNLARFKKAGGRVLTLDELEKVRPVARITPVTEAIRAIKRVHGQKALYFFTNEADRDVKARIELPESGDPVLCDPQDGKCYRVRRAGQWLDWTFAPFGSALFLFGVAPDAVLPVFQPGPAGIDLARGWTLRPTRQFTAGRQTYQIASPRTRAKPVKLGDWRPWLGGCFSGDALYAITFVSPSNAPAQLDLGKVGYACAVTLNGEEIGRKFWGPYVFDLTGHLRQGKNTLAVSVTNTLANAISSPATEAYWDKAFPPRSSYETITRTYEKDSLSSGLFGSAQIRFGRYSPGPNVGRQNVEEGSRSRTRTSECKLQAGAASGGTGRPGTRCADPAWPSLTFTLNSARGSGSPG